MADDTTNTAVEAKYIISLSGDIELVGVAHAKTGHPTRLQFQSGSGSKMVAPVRVVPGQVYAVFWQVWGKSGSKGSISFKRDGKQEQSIKKDWVLKEPDPNDPVFPGTKMRGGDFWHYAAK